MSFGNIKKKKRLLVLLLCTILAGASFMTGCGSKADENGSAQVSAEEKNVTETQEQTEAESEQIMTEATETAQIRSRRVHHHRLRTQSSLLRLEIPRLAQSSLLRWKTRRQIQPRQTFPVIWL